MSRRAGKVDGNQAAIVKGLRDAGCTVAVLSGAGAGFPDLVVGLRCRNFLFELKRAKARDDLTPAQVAFHTKWRGQVHVIETVQEALEVMRRAF